MKNLILACAVCYADSASPLAKAATLGALFLMGVVLFVLGGIAATIFVWIRRARKLRASSLTDASKFWR